MISDVLSDAEARIREYLDHEGTRDCYQGLLRGRINILLAEMVALRMILDAPPGVTTLGDDLPTDTFTTQEGAVFSMEGATCPRCQHPAKLSDVSGAAGYFRCRECELVYDEPDFTEGSYVTTLEEA